MVRIRSASWVLASQVTSLLLRFPLSVVLARGLGPAGKGDLSLVQLVTSLSLAFVSLGLPSAVTYLAAQRKVGGRSVLRLSLVFAAVPTLVLVLLAVLTGDWVTAELVKVSSSLHLVLGCLALFPSLVQLFLSSYLVGLGEIRTTAITNVSLLGLQLVFVSLLAVSGMLTSLAAVYAWIATTIIGATWFARVALRKGPAEGLSPRGVIREGLTYGLASWAASAVGLLALRLDMLLVSTLGTVSAVGVYSITVTLAEMLFFIPRAVGQVLLPKVASDPDEGARISARMLRSVWPVTLSAGVVLGALAWVFVPVVYGQDFLQVRTVFWLLVPGTVMSAIAGAAGSYHAGSGHPVRTLWANVANLTINVLANLALIPRYGIAGAALSSSLSYTAGALMQLLSFKRATALTWKQVLVPTRADVQEVWFAVSDALQWKRLKRYR
ncbi:MAG: polysaccharide biosynthesis C-terminal domain-containing protein [Anaerosomatales bacterium]|nr:polysaccharide biosynthesis C-terminal domain-containing protein [Anaerosomatales bacterium]